MKEQTFGPWTLSNTERDRLDGYQRLRDLATKDAEKHDKLFQRDKNEMAELHRQTGKFTDSCLPHLYVNLPSLVARSAADLVLSQPPIITGETDEVTARIDMIRQRSNLDALLWRAIFWTSILGDTFLLIADKKEGGKDQPIIKLRRALNTVARNIRPEDSEDVRSLLCKSLIDGIELFTLYKSSAIEFAAFKKNEKGEYVPAELPKGYAPNIDTRETAPLFVPLSALRGDDSDENFGESDIQDTDELAFEIANRLRQTQKILDKHAEPAQNVPEGTIDDKGVHNARTAKVFERDLQGKGMEYVTWQSALQEGYSEIDRVLKLIALITETPTTLWGLDGEGEAESGRALKFRLLTGLGKARRTGMMLKAGIAAAIRLALRREDVLAGRTKQDYKIKVELSETFIADEQETAEHVVKLRQAGAMSIKEAVRVGQGKTGDELEAEVEAIESEQPDELGFERARLLGGDPNKVEPGAVDPAEAPVDVTPLKEGDVPVDKQTPVEPLEINGAVVQGLIELAKFKFMSPQEIRDRLGLTKATPQQIADIEKLLFAAAAEGPAA